MHYHHSNVVALFVLGIALPAFAAPVSHNDGKALVPSTDSSPALANLQARSDSALAGHKAKKEKRAAQKPVDAQSNPKVGCHTKYIEYLHKKRADLEGERAAFVANGGDGADYELQITALDAGIRQLETAELIGIEIQPTPFGPSIIPAPGPPPYTRSPR